MGVPSFYRWLVNKYPQIVVKAVEGNEYQFDNLYLDMNGIIHSCFHPDDHPSPPTTFEEVYNMIYEFIDHLFRIVKPQKLLFMAIDGVAPRAKMNQQRSRRFRTAKDSEIADEKEEKLRKQFEMEGKPVLPKRETEVSDSNVITPGTEFMYQLGKKLQNYVTSRLTTDPGWKNIQVILSDANVPGEGEHKIMSFIRVQRSLPGYDPKTKHCLYGLDADLIILALATHEVHFSILREDVLLQEQQPMRESVLESKKSRGWFGNVNAEGECTKDPKIDSKIGYLTKKPYEFLHVWILRKYLELDLNISDPPENFKIDFERIIDDFIFMCTFTGNDFLPHLPTLEIHEGAIDLLMYVYKRNFKNLGGYLIDMQRSRDKKAGYIKLSRVEKFTILVSGYEEKIFKKRAELREHKLKRLCQQHEEEQLMLEMNKECEFFDGNTLNFKDFEIISADSCSSSSENTDNSHGYDSEVVKQILRDNTRELKEMLKHQLHKKTDLFKDGSLGIDKVKLGTAGWKERYYKEKFSVGSPNEIESTRKEIVQKYTEGLMWVLLYYFSGVPSWTWFYPYHYGPFASDLKGLSQVKVKFQKGSPFKPFDQLMGVLPPRSSHALPRAYQTLMTDLQSNIIDFYPTDFEIDNDGKRFAWQGICNLSFIDENRLLAETNKLKKELMDDEEKRNSNNVDQVFTRKSSKCGSSIAPLIPKLLIDKQKEFTSMSSGVCGFICLYDNNFIEFGFSSSERPPNDVQENDVLHVFFELPAGRAHIPRPLEGTDFPETKLTEADIEETILWHDYPGHKPFIRYQNQGTGQGKRIGMTGFGVGRGKSSDNADSFRPERISNPLTRNPSKSGERVQTCSSSSWDVRPKFVANKASSGSDSSENTNKWRVVSSRYVQSAHRSQWGSSNDVGREVTYLDAKPSSSQAQGRGRGHFSPALNVTKWKSRDNAQSSGMGNRSRW